MEVPEIDVSGLADAMDRGASLFDVREPGEYAQARIPGAQLVPMATVPEHVDEFRGNEPVYVVCATGRRSATVVEFLHANGIDALNVAGGTKAWIDGGKEYESDHQSL